VAFGGKGRGIHSPLKIFHRQRSGNYWRRIGFGADDGLGEMIKVVGLGDDGGFEAELVQGLLQRARANGQPQAGKLRHQLRQVETLMKVLNRQAAGEDDPIRSALAQAGGLAMGIGCLGLHAVERHHVHGGAQGGESFGDLFGGPIAAQHQEALPAHRAAPRDRVQDQGRFVVGGNRGGLQVPLAQFFTAATHRVRSCLPP
jgi:hypothetical protein